MYCHCLLVSTCAKLVHQGHGPTKREIRDTVRSNNVLFCFVRGSRFFFFFFIFIFPILEFFFYDRLASCIFSAFVSLKLGIKIALSLLSNLIYSLLFFFYYGMAMPLESRKRARTEREREPVGGGDP